MDQIRLTIIEEGRNPHAFTAPLPLELGRQRDRSSQVYQVQDLKSHYRVDIAPSEALALPRDAIRIEAGTHEGDGLSLRVKNIHRSMTFLLKESQQTFPPGDETSNDQSFAILLSRSFEVQIELVQSPEVATPREESPGSNLRMTQVSVSDLEVEENESEMGALLRDKVGGDPGRLAVAMVKRALEVVKKTAGSDEFFDAAIRSVANMVELDHAYVLRLENDAWGVTASYAREQNESWNQQDHDDVRELPAGCRQLLNRLLRDRRTIVFEPNNFMQTAGSSLLLLDRAVAAPMLDSEQRVIGALYGDRRMGSNAPDEPIGDLEAALIEVMAAAVASGIARQSEEDARKREEALRASMNQFFSPEVLNQLHQDERLLSGRDAEVTVLFCDIRGFSAITERVGPQRTIRWINDVLTELSQCVLDTDGVLVDYIGDELMAMWGAPTDQPDHALRACKAAAAMLNQIEPLRNRWHDITPDKFGIGIGIDTGKARVGNTGSKLKFKYGPLGNTVNLASRTQGMTKQFGVPALITGATRSAILSEPSSDSLSCRKIADVQPVGVQTHLSIHQLIANPDPSWCQMRDQYENALEAYQQSDLSTAARSLVELIDSHPDDKPAVMLLQRVVNAIASGESEVDPVTTLTTK